MLNYQKESYQICYKWIVTDSISDTWKKRMNSYNHIARLPYENPARIRLFGKMIHHNRSFKRSFFSVERS